MLFRSCHIHHSLGHTEATSFTVPIDPEDRMKAAQRVASSLTYAKRYAFCNGFGIMTGDEDDDAATSSEAPSARPAPPPTANKPPAPKPQAPPAAQKQNPSPPRSAETTELDYFKSRIKAAKESGNTKGMVGIMHEGKEALGDKFGALVTYANSLNKKGA